MKLYAAQQMYISHNKREGSSSAAAWQVSPSRDGEKQEKKEDLWAGAQAEGPPVLSNPAPSYWWLWDGITCSQLRSGALAVSKLLTETGLGFCPSETRTQPSPLRYSGELMFTVTLRALVCESNITQPLHPQRHGLRFPCFSAFFCKGLPDSQES